jgi:hypothetical protein
LRNWSIDQWSNIAAETFVALSHAVFATESQLLRITRCPYPFAVIAACSAAIAACLAFSIAAFLAALTPLIGLRPIWST